VEVLFSLPEEHTTEDRRQFLPHGFFYFRGVGVESSGVCLFFVILESSVEAGSSVLILPAVNMFKPRLRPGIKPDSNMRAELCDQIVVICQKCKVCCPIVSVCESFEGESLMCVRSGMGT